MINEVKSPAFQFYPKDFLTDSKVIVMSPEVRGLYITLLCIDWLEDGFHKDEMTKLSGFEWYDHEGNLRSQDDHGIAIGQLSACFMAHPSKLDFITNPRLQNERKMQLQRRAERSKSGKEGAKSRWNNELNRVAQPMAQPYDSHELANGKPITNYSSSSSSASIQNTHTQIRPKSLEEVLNTGSLSGIPKDYCEWFWNHYEGNGWNDGNGHPLVGKWQSKLTALWIEEKAKREKERQRNERFNKNGSYTPEKKPERTPDQIEEAIKFKQDMAANQFKMEPNDIAAFCRGSVSNGNLARITRLSSKQYDYLLSIVSDKVNAEIQEKMNGNAQRTH